MTYTILETRGRQPDGALSLTSFYQMKSWSFETLLSKIPVTDENVCFEICEILDCGEKKIAVIHSGNGLESVVDMYGIGRGVWNGLKQCWNKKPAKNNNKKNRRR